MAILPNLADLSREQLEAKLLAMMQAGQRKLTCKVTEKGGLSVYGLGRFPVTLYVSQWERLLDHADVITQAIKDNPGLSRKE